MSGFEIVFFSYKILHAFIYKNILYKSIQDEIYQNLRMSYE